MNLGNEVGYAGNRPLVVGDPLGLQGGVSEEGRIVFEGKLITPGGHSAKLLILDVNIVGFDRQGQPQVGSTLPPLPVPGPQPGDLDYVRGPDAAVTKVAGRQPMRQIYITILHEYYHWCSAGDMAKAVRAGASLRDVLNIGRTDSRSCDGHDARATKLVNAMSDSMDMMSRLTGGLPLAGWIL
jgi:hypothetical protein